MSLAGHTDVQKKTVAVDLDGVLASWKDGWKGPTVIGPPIPYAKEFMVALMEHFHVVIWTARLSSDFEDRDRDAVRLAVLTWLSDHRIPYSAVWEGQAKPVACAYVDDRAVTCDPEQYGPDAYKNAFEIVKNFSGIR